MWHSAIRFRAGVISLVIYLETSASATLMFRHWFASISSDILLCDAGIAAANYSHVWYLPWCADYYLFYRNLLSLRVVNIAALHFATLAHKLLVDFKASCVLKTIDLQTHMRILD
jgi:hypothetical protein